MIYHRLETTQMEMSSQISISGITSADEVFRDGRHVSGKCHGRGSNPPELASILNISGGVTSSTMALARNMAAITKIANHHEYMTNNDEWREIPPYAPARLPFHLCSL